MLGYLKYFKGTSPQLVCMFFGTLNALSDGMHFGWSAPTVPILEGEDSPIKITQTDVLWLELLYMIFGVVGLPITIYLADKIGRQKSVLVASTTSLIGWTLIGTAQRKEFLYVARSMVGAAADVAFVCSPMYVAEIAHKKIRGFLAGTIYVMELGGVLIIYCLGPFVSMRIPPIVGACIVTTQLVIFPFMPESPYYHVYKGNEEAARKSLKFLRGTDDIEDEYIELSKSIQKQKKERGKIQDLFLVKSNRRAVIVMLILNGGQHMVGYTALLMNLHTILNTAGATLIKTDYSAIVYCGIMLISSIFAITIVDKFGRRKLMYVSCIFSAIFLIVVGVFFHLQYSGVDVSAITWVPVVFIMSYAAFFKLGLGTVPIVMTSELFSARIKALGMTFADLLYVGFASISIYVYQFIDINYGLHYNFYMFAGFSILTLILTVFFVPETKGRSLDEIQTMLKN